MEPLFLLLPLFGTAVHQREFSILHGSSFKEGFKAGATCCARRSWTMLFVKDFWSAIGFSTPILSSDRLGDIHNICCPSQPSSETFKHICCPMLLAALEA